MHQFVSLCLVQMQRSKHKFAESSVACSSSSLDGKPKKKKTVRPLVLVVQLTLLAPPPPFRSFVSMWLVFIFVCFFKCALFVHFLQLCRQKVKAVGKLGVRRGQRLDLPYSHFHGPSSTRENPAGLPILPLVTCKQLSRTSICGAKAPSFTHRQRLGAEKPLRL